MKVVELNICEVANCMRVPLYESVAEYSNRYYRLFWFMMHKKVFKVIKNFSQTVHMRQSYENMYIDGDDMDFEGQLKIGRGKLIVAVRLDISDPMPNCQCRALVESIVGFYPVPFQYAIYLA